MASAKNIHTLGSEFGEIIHAWDGVNENARWKLKKKPEKGEKIFAIQNVHTGLFINLHEGRRGNGAELRMYHIDDDNSLFRIYEAEGGTYCF